MVRAGRAGARGRWVRLGGVDRSVRSGAQGIGAHGFGWVIGVAGRGAGPLGTGARSWFGAIWRGGRAAGSAAVPSGAADGDGLPPGGAGRRLAGAGGLERLGPDAPRPALGPAGSGRARRDD